MTTQDQPGKSVKEKIVPLTGLSVEELQVLAQAIIAPDDQEQLQGLLAKNRDNSLSTDEQVLLDKLLGEVDRVALFKAKALYTLKHWRERYDC